MSEERQSTDPMADYEAQLEQHEFLKREGIGAWTDMMLDMLGDKVDPDKRILIREGLLNVMAGPPRMPLPPSINIDAEFVPPQPVRIPAFTFEAAHNGIRTLYDWRVFAEDATHYDYADHTVIFYRYDETLMTLRGEPADAFIEWQAAIRVLQYQPAPCGPRMRRRTRRRQS